MLISQFNGPYNFGRHPKRAVMESYSNETLACDVETDKSVWSFFKKGDQYAFAVLYQRYFKILFQYGNKLAEDSELVKDCIHDVFIDLWKKKENLSEPKSVKAYLLGAIQHKLIRQVSRTRIRQNEIIKMEPADVVASIEDQTQVEQTRIVSNALHALTKRQQEAIYLKFYCNLSYKEVAATMSITVDSIYNLISKAIDELQVELNKVPDRKASLR